MPTPMSPMKPMNAAQAMMAKAKDNLEKGGGPNTAMTGGVSTMDKLKAMANGTTASPADATGAKQPGEKAFSIKTAQDPDGTIHLYAKNEQEAKQKYQQLGNPLGNANAAEEVKEAGFPTASDWFSKKLNKVASKGAAKIGWDYTYPDSKTFDPEEEEKKPFGNYRQSWTRKNVDNRYKNNDSSSKPSSDRQSFQRSTTNKPWAIVTTHDRRGETVIMAATAEEAAKKWEKRFGKTGDKILKVFKPRDMEESMNTTLKTTFEGIEDTISDLLESFGLENGRDFYIDGTIRTLDEQVAQDILSVLADHEMPGQANLRRLSEGWAISLIGQGEELVENLTIGNDAIEIRHIGEGVVRVYVNQELAEQFDTGTAAFKYVKTLQQNLAEAEQELMSALSAEAGEDLMKISNITEGWEDMLKAVKDRDDKKVGDKWKTSKGEVTKTSTGVIHTRSYDPKTGESDDEKPKDADGNPVKRGRGRPKKVRESLAAIQAMRKQVAEALAKIDRLPEAQRNTAQVQAMVDRLTESVRNAIARAK